MRFAPGPVFEQNVVVEEFHDTVEIVVGPRLVPFAEGHFLFRALFSMVKTLMSVNLVAARRWSAGNFSQEGRHDAYLFCRVQIVHQRLQASNALLMSEGDAR